MRDFSFAEVEDGLSQLLEFDWKLGVESMRINRLDLLEDLPMATMCLLYSAVMHLSLLGMWITSYGATPGCLSL